MVRIMRTTRRDCLAFGAVLLISCRDSRAPAPPKPQTITLTVEGMT
jgi:hypothetical protein